MNGTGNSSVAWMSRIRFAVVRFCNRRRFVVKQRLQYSLLVLTLCYALFFILSVAAMLFTPLIVRLHTQDASSLEASQTAIGLLYLHDNYWITVLLPLVIIALHSILTSHKIAGPLYRFGKVFRAVEDGVIPRPVQLRKGDFLKTEMGQINRMLLSLRARIEEIQNMQGEIRETLSGCRGGEEKASPDGQKRILKELEQKSAELEKKLAEFRIEV